MAVVPYLTVETPARCAVRALRPSILIRKPHTLRRNSRNTITAISTTAMALIGKSLPQMSMRGSRVS